MALYCLEVIEEGACLSFSYAMYKFGHVCLFFLQDRFRLVSTLEYLICEVECFLTGTFFFLFSFDLCNLPGGKKCAKVSGSSQSKRRLSLSAIRRKQVTFEEMAEILRESSSSLDVAGPFPSFFGK